MDAQYVIDKLLRAGSTIQIDGERLAVAQPECIDSELRELIKEYREEIYNHLKTANGDASKKIIILKLQQIIEMVIENAWGEYGSQFSPTEVARQIVEISTTAGLSDCTDEYLEARAKSIVIRMIQQRGHIPKGWDEVSRCARCGSVWSDHGIDTLSCGWCHLREAGKSFPQPTTQRSGNEDAPW